MSPPDFRPRSFADEVTRLRAEVERLQEEQVTGCCSHDCILKQYGVAPRGGIGTNSGKCYCPEWKWRRVLQKQAAEVERERKLRSDALQRSHEKDAVIEAAFRALQDAEVWIAERERGTTHWEGCEEQHRGCRIMRDIATARRLREARETEEELDQ